MTGQHLHPPAPLLPALPSPESAAGCVVLQAETDRSHTVWLGLFEPVEVIEARSPSAVLPALERLERAVAEGMTAAGFLTYEAAPAFDKALTTHEPGPLPVLWFGLYRDVVGAETIADAPPVALSAEMWTPTVTAEEYEHAVRRIRAYLESGDTYQVNYTFRLRAPFGGDPWALFATLVRAQRSRHAAFVHTGKHVICSASPELFFALDGTRILSRPMKGTAPRGLTLAEDLQRAQNLARSEKERAENTMIVDMVRNDLGRVAAFGSVAVPHLHTLEKYPTVWQMTSTVSAETPAPLREIFRALFPSASVTGAPKVRTMEIIRELESTPRGIYTGAIGFIAPKCRAQFNVAIRTLHLDLAQRTAEYGTGGGIVWDSAVRAEFAECRLKSAILFRAWPAFELLETLRWDPEQGFLLLERHLARLADSAAYFDYPFDREQVVAALQSAAGNLPAESHVLRLTLSARGEVRITTTPLSAHSRPPCWRVALARRPVDKQHVFLYHKTTNRAVYEEARREVSGADDVVLWNSQGYVTESTTANVVLRRSGKWITPPVSCGLLAGVFRAELLARGEIEEDLVTCEDWMRAEEVRLINSVRGWIPVERMTN